MIHDTHNIHNIRHTMPDFNNSGTTLMVYNTSQKIQHSKHNSQYIHRQQTKNTIQHETHVGPNALAVVQTLSMIYTAQCAGSSSNKMCDLQHITHEGTMQYLHTAHTAE